MELRKQCADIVEMLSKQHSDSKRTNTECQLVKDLHKCVIFTTQRICFRGDTNSNLMQLLTLRAQEDPKLQAWMEHKNDRYLSHDMQNKLLKAMALTILAKIDYTIKNSKIFSNMCDECTDASKQRATSSMHQMGR